MKKFYILILISILIILTTDTASAYWFNSSYPVMWNNPIPDGYRYYQFEVTIHTGSGTSNSTDLFAGGGKNIVFTWTSNNTPTINFKIVQNNITEIPFWFKNISVDNTTAKVRINITGNGSFQIYGGGENYSYNNTLGGTNTLDLYEDFEDGYYNGIRCCGYQTWTAGNDGGTLSIQTDSTKYLQSTLTSSTQILSSSAYSGKNMSNFMYEGRYQYSGADVYTGIIFRVSAPNTFYIMWFQSATANLIEVSKISAGTRTDLCAISITAPLSTWTNFKITMNQTGTMNITYGSTTATCTNNDLPGGQQGIGQFTYHTPLEKIDDISVQRYLTPEPSIGVWSDTNSIGAPKIISNSTSETFTACYDVAGAITNWTINGVIYHSGTTNSTGCDSYTLDDNFGNFTGYNISVYADGTSGNSNLTTWIKDYSASYSQGVQITIKEIIKIIWWQ